METSIPTTRTELADLLRNNRAPWATNTEHAEMEQAQAAAILAAGYHKPHTITTAEGIKDLPALTMVVYDDMANGGPLEAYVVPDDGTVMFKDRYPFHLLCMNGEYVKAEDMPLPLTVVYEVGA